MASRTVRMHRSSGSGGRVAKIFAVGFLVTIVLLIVLGFAGYGVAKSWLKDLPDYTDPKTFEVAQPTTILASDGSVMAKLYIENRESIPLADMGPYLPVATVAVEDARFYKHKGFDPIGIARAVIANLTSGDATGEGASTITQQYIRQTILRDEMYTKSYERKVREAYLAYELEKLYTKDQILEMYLNTVYYGSGAYGAEAASKEMFAKSAKDLTLSEAALLAGLPQQPSRLDPYENFDGAVERRNTVLRRMHDQGYISQEEYDAAVAEPMTVQRLEKPEDGIYFAPYYVAHVKKVLQNQFSEGTVFSGGLTVQTPLNPALQNAAEEAVTDMIGDSGPDGALVSIDPNTGNVVALYGGRNFAANPFNFATQAHRQPGSSFKMFTLTTAISEGMSPDFTLDSSSPANIKTDSGTWKVQNSGGGGRGMVTLRNATEQSLNTPFARLIVELGPQNVVNTAHKMGITSELSPVPSLTLGTSGVTTLEMASAFGTLATGGLHHDPVFVTKVTDKNGTVLFEEATASEQVIDPSVAWAVNDVLKGDITKGTATQARISGHTIAGKTGTSQENRDAWFVGYTPDLVTSVWVGYTPEKTGYIKGSLIWGGTVCCPIWKSYMGVALAGLPDKDFPKADPPKYDNSKFKVESGGGRNDNEDAPPSDPTVPVTPVPSNPTTSAP